VAQQARDALAAREIPRPHGASQAILVSLPSGLGLGVEPPR
jgi:hypothetical protein